MYEQCSYTDRSYTKIHILLMITVDMKIVITLWEVQQQIFVVHMWHTTRPFTRGIGQAYVGS